MFQKVLVPATMLLAALVSIGLAQQPGGAAKGKGAPKQSRPPAFFSEKLKETPGGEHAVNQDSVTSSDLELKLYTTKGEIMVTGSDKDENNPTHYWTGLCEAACAMSYRHKENFADLTGLARIRWTHKMSGFHQIRPIVKLADGTWLVGDKAEGSATDWTTTEILLADVKWLKLDIKRVVTTGTWVMNPDLSKVDEIGFADLLPGSGHGAGGWSDVGLMEVYAKPVKRS